MPCVAHTVNLVINDAVNAKNAEFGSAVRKITQVAKFFRKSLQAAAALGEEVKKDEQIFLRRLGARRRICLGNSSCLLRPAGAVSSMLFDASTSCFLLSPQSFIDPS